MKTLSLAMLMMVATPTTTDQPTPPVIVDLFAIAQLYDDPFQDDVYVVLTAWADFTDMTPVDENGETGTWEILVKWEGGDWLLLPHDTGVLRPDSLGSGSFVSAQDFGLWYFADKKLTVKAIAMNPSGEFSKEITIEVETGGVGGGGNAPLTADRAKRLRQVTKDSPPVPKR